MRRVHTFTAVLIALALLCPAPAIAGYPASVERWRPKVRQQLKRYDVWSKRAENTMLNIIHHESTGNPKCRYKGHVGLLQFNRSWVRGGHDWRTDAGQSIRRCAKVLKESGWSGWERHWAATIYK